MKILAIDDEKIAMEGLVSAIKEVEPEAQVYGFQKASQALEFYKGTPCEVVFLDIQMRNMNGVELAKKMKMINPMVNIIFATGYGDYREIAFDMHASGYLIKPITPQKIQKELDDLRHPVSSISKNRVQFCTFGNFEIYVDGTPVVFHYDKTKEMLAYLVDRNGAYCSNAEIMAALWEDKKRPSYLSNLKKDLLDAFRKKNCENIIETSWGKMRINTKEVGCDYYDWCEGKIQAINSYRGEYMSQYSWAEFTNGVIEENKKNW